MIALAELNSASLAALDPARTAFILNTSAIGFPGVVDGYQVDVQVPSDAARGIATVEVTAAWIQGPAVSLPIR